VHEWNVVLTSHPNQEDRLLQELAGLGDFQPSGFREVIVGLVDDPQSFLETLRHRWETQPFLPEFLSTVAPVRAMFPFRVHDLMDRLLEHIEPLAREIDGRAFYVRLKRRGHKGRIHSQEVEQALDQFLKEEIASQGFSPVIDFTEPECVVVVELVHNQAGVGLITREHLARYPFLFPGELGG
jgi:tRNA(Ser,Leu) C12 N-acetylase TAN1